MSLPSQVTNWLYNVLQPQYINKQVAYTHLYQFLEVHLKKNLRFRIRTQVFTSGDGHSNLLINLFGTISAKDASVPVEIWVPLSYPFAGGTPLVFVVPKHEEGLYLRPGNHVDTQGRIYHPYLAAWHNECTPENPEATRFNLLELINVVYEIVTKENPIQLAPNPPGVPAQMSPVATGPKLPPKPSILQLGTQSTASGDPNAPQKPLKVPIAGTSSPVSTKSPSPAQAPNPVPLKYQAPLPLPDERAQPALGRPQPPLAQPSHEIHHQRVPSGQNYPIEANHQQRPYPKAPYQPPPQAYQSPISPPQLNQTKSPVRNQPARTKPAAPSLDLMDSNEAAVNGGSRANSDGHNEQALISNALQFLNEASSGSAFAIAPEAKHEEAKINALHSQLTHHHQQAEANSKNLDEHIRYLGHQLKNVTKLNQELSALDEVNALQADRVLTKDTTLDLDDLIIADLTLVKQLYEVVLEIKAIKDTISLVNGSFHSQPELINDSRIDICVKTVRNLGRELFWLELTKNEIASIMDLETN
ncbi:UEV-domain-containing protein [Suhomyces tanzawaensis NRRL Y-17324]|uniref:UEV-domain-containing protein n=1 Tax=Suhomyces tanzawaensis NRRL Y-17324 TaxID=984487 RepID=A0A1E4SPD6_9ASCO|nr:UEV-domain-containing protein [Suhomyces tanzawaensis NRRL Y-17324]ODV81365.1 UEV-domain-containing protein [Suhomyces tanzawaensis NRRL Y-17324]